MALPFRLITAFVLVLFLAFESPLQAEEEVAKPFLTLSGYISDASTGEMLIGGTLYITELSGGTATNVYGYYSVRLDPGSYSLTYSYIGYNSKQLQLDLRNDTLINIKLSPQEMELNEVVITGESALENVRRPQMSVARLDIKNIRQIPAFMGEVDVIKALQLLPGVQATSEGGSGFSVRGGSPDQNLILLDEALVYNPSHLLGFFSVFNNDAVKSVELYKGDIPSEYGGRLSSVVDVRMNDGNSQRITGQGGVGTISSRLTLEGPIQKDKSSFMLAGRRTYADLFLALSPNEDVRNNTLYFYDFNGKANYTFNDKNRLFVSGYFGKDVFKNESFALGWGNQTLTVRWNHLFSPKIFSNFSLIYSRFNYELGIPEGEPNAFDWNSRMQDYALKSDFTWFASASSTLKFGLHTTFHSFSPGTAVGLGEETAFNKLEVPESFALESGIYFNNEHQLSNRLTLKYGLRLSMFNNIGKGTVYQYDEQYEKVDSVVYPSGEIYQTFANLEPRFSLAWKLDEFSSVKAAYTRNAQYVHLAQNSTAGTPLDIWFPTGPNVKPQLGDQFSAGYFRYFPKEKLETSVEGFYKLNHNAIDFKDHAELLLNEYLDGELRFGKAWSYGLEFLVRLNEGRLNGWVSYTWSRTFREIPEINKGKPYPASYDRPHDVSIVANYKLSKRIDLGANWVYSTGSAVTFPTGRFTIGNTIAPVYSDRNAYRLPDYHRLDISITLRAKEKPGRKWTGEWNLSVYNAYYRKNPWVINFIADPEQPNVTNAEMTYLFGIVPAITYNFKF
ncbi:MAG: TonB-dependent receptor [Bacteroidetes bacterium]|nr:TonB-dependent receptor [Bacteroidota bacterium]